MHKRWKPLLLFLFAFLIIASGGYIYYNLKIRQIYYYPIYKSINTINYDKYNVELGPYPAAVSVVDANVQYSNTNDKFPMASTVKLVTALSLIDKIGQDKLAESIRITPNDTAITQAYINKGGAVVPVSAGQIFTYSKALEYLLVISANNFADILVNSQFSSQEDYLAYANSWLAQKGLQDTTVSDASGFSPTTVTTPQNLADLGRLAIQNTTIRELVGLRQTTLPSGQIKKSTNYFLDSKYGEVIGIKTGNTDEAGFVYVTALESSDKPTVIASVMQAPSRYVSQSQAVNIADSLGSSYKVETLFTPNQEVLKLNLPWQDNVDVITNQAITIANIGSQDIKYILVLNTFSKDTQAGQVIGQLTVSSNIASASYPLYLSEHYLGINTSWLLKNPAF